MVTTQAAHQPGVRRVASDDRARVVELISRAFFDDPTWSWAFPERATRMSAYAQWWDLFVGSAIGHGWVWATDDWASVSVWLPPGEPELTEAEEARVEPLLREFVPPGRRDAVAELLDLFDQNHPEGPPHFYLSLLATDPERRGHGTGLALLAANLKEVDVEGAAAYLEASNPANVRLYERHGFAVHGGFGIDDGPRVATMWRPGQR